MMPHRTRTNSKDLKSGLAPGTSLHYSPTYKFYLRRYILSFLLITTVTAATVAVLFNLCITCVGGLQGHVHYGIIIDAGSTGSRVFVYNMVDERILEHRAGVCSPGISSLGAGAYDCIGSRLVEAIAFIPAEERGHTPVYLMATAGMRLLSEEDQASIYREIDERYRRSDLPFLFPLDNMVTISGESEAFYVWVAIQYLLGTLPLDIQTRLGPTVGALDLGGSSTQITFEPKDPFGRIRGSVSTLNEDHVFTHSYLEYGVNRMRDKVDGLVAVGGVQRHTGRSTPSPSPSPPPSRNNGTEGGVDPFLVTADHPCYHTGHSQTYPLTGHAEYSGYTVIFTGSSNSKQCEDVIRRAMKVDAPCPSPPCAMDGIYQPEVKGKFMATSAYFYVLNALDRFIPHSMSFPSPSIEEIERTVHAYCHSAWDFVVDEFSFKDENTNSLSLPHRCLEATYILVLLRDAFKFPVTEHLITFTITVNSSSLDWTLGSMLAMNAEFPQPDHLGRSLCVNFLAGLLVLVLLGYALRAYSRFKQGQRRPTIGQKHVAVTPGAPERTLTRASRSLVDLATVFSLSMVRDGNYTFADLGSPDDEEEKDV